MNLGEAQAFPIFGLLNLITNSFEELDPRIASVKMEVVQADWSASPLMEVILHKDLELHQITPETQPRAFANGSVLNGFASTIGLLGIKDPYEVTMFNDYQA